MIFSWLCAAWIPAFTIHFCEMSLNFFSVDCVCYALFVIGSHDGGKIGDDGDGRKDRANKKRTRKKQEETEETHHGNNNNNDEFDIAR